MGLTDKPLNPTLIYYNEVEGELLMYDIGEPEEAPQDQEGGCAPEGEEKGKRMTVNGKRFELTPMQSELLKKIGKADETLVGPARGIGGTFAAMLWAAQCAGSGGNVLWISSCPAASMEHAYRFAGMFPDTKLVRKNVVRSATLGTGVCFFAAASEQLSGWNCERLVIDGVRDCCDLGQYSRWLVSFNRPKVLGIWDGSPATGSVLSIFPTTTPGQVTECPDGRKRLVIEQRSAGNKFLFAADPDYRRRINDPSVKKNLWEGSWK